MKRETPANLQSDISLLATPPLLDEHHVRLPGQLAQILNAESAHSIGITGKGVRVAMIDSGFYPHPFYVERGYQIRHVPTRRERKPHVDEYGHGTAQLASFFSVAPEAEILAIKCMDRDPSHALEQALKLGANVLSCAWGFNIDSPFEGGKRRELPRQYRRMHGLLLEAVREGVTIVAAGGNGQYAFPGSMPEVIAAGGIYYAPDGALYASDISSRFESGFFPGRFVPDVCGIVGNWPHGRLLLVPVPPDAKLARRPGFATIAAGDSSEVKGMEGWAMFSGTSAATAMVSGACAVLLQKDSGLSPDALKSLLSETARVVPESGCRLLDVGAALQRLK